MKGKSMKNFRPQPVYELPDHVMEDKYAGCGRALVAILVDTDEVLTIDYLSDDKLLRAMDCMPTRQVVKAFEDEELRVITYEAVLSQGSAILCHKFGTCELSIVKPPEV